VTASLLAIFAHPDDESLACGGLLARCADEGVRVSLLCMTRGEHGPGGEPAALGAVRARELGAAAGVLGIHDVTVLGHEDGMLPWIDAGMLESDILVAVRRVLPDVIVTFDEDGLYGHPDHLAVHARTTAVVERLGATAPALFYVSMPRGAMRAVVETASGAPRAAKGAPLLGVPDPDAFGGFAPAASLVLDVGDVATRKLAALRCHRTQVEGGSFDALAERDAPRLLGTECYRRATVGRTGPTFIDALGTTTSAPASR
jgi:N-acetyl-1-D-myo-inositol-2-amino-2-deoxy-alpha-D-glucopyranoside deacetylase